MPRLTLTAIALALFSLPSPAADAHVWEVQEIELQSARDYTNPYTEVLCWIDLTGPGFSKRIYGFWDGGRTFRIRYTATAPGQWTWRTNSNQPADSGLNGHSGTLTARAWIEQEKQQNPNRHGILRATPNGHALEYADGTPFFLVGDTWLAGSTWRLPLMGQAPPPNYEPGPGITFEDAVAYRKRQGYNSVSMIAAFPAWASDQYPYVYADDNGIVMRDAWEKFGVVVADGRPTAKDMQDERGYRPFEILPNRQGLPNYDRIVPQYFQSLDRKMEYLTDQGLVPMLETVRRDQGPAWKAYFDFDESFSRYVQYLVSRYGAYNMVFSKIHLDYIPPKRSLTADEFNEALNYHYKKYGPMPYGQPVSSLIDSSTYTRFGHGASAPWLTMQSVGNNPRNHSVSPMIEELFRLEPPAPAIDLEPHYTGWDHNLSRPDGEVAARNSDRDNYFSRAQMYGCVLSGALAGHVHGTGAYDITTTGEAEGPRPYIWDALRFTSGAQMQYLAKFILSEGRRYQDLVLGSADLTPRKAPGSSDTGLDGWSFMMRTADKDLALLYFENKAVPATVSNLKPGAAYTLTWYNPLEGTWLAPVSLQSDSAGRLTLPALPGDHDWAAKLITRRQTERSP